MRHSQFLQETPTDETPVKISSKRTIDLSTRSIDEFLTIGTPMFAEEKSQNFEVKEKKDRFFTDET
jgi:hypothetical protein